MNMAIIIKSISISDICTTLYIFKEQSCLLIGDQYELRNFSIIVHEIDSVNDDTQDHHDDKDGNNADFEDFQHFVLLI
jgi:5-methylcytosine-specific restriction endonuclease McrBC GTP-binding regulatory subunit McrB